MKKSNILIFSLLSVFSHLTYAEEYPSNHSLVDILPENYRSSPYYRILDIRLDNDLYSFDVETEVGIHTILSIDLLIKRLNEIELLSQAKYEYNEDKQHEITPRPIRIQSDSAVDLITAPLSSVSGLVEQFADNVSDTLSGAFYHTTPDTFYSLSEIEPNFDMHRRNIAAQIGIDFYSYNRYIQSYLNSIARARSAGNISAGTRHVNFNRNDKHYPDNGSIEKEAEQLIRQYTRSELRVHHRAKLKSMRVSDKSIERFLNHRYLSPSIQTKVIEYLDFLYKVRNSAAAISAALNLTSNAEAHNYLHTVRMLTAFYMGNPFERISANGKHLLAYTKGGKVVLFISSDMFYQNPFHMNLMEDIISLYKQKKYRLNVITQGKISNAMKRYLLEHEINYQERFSSMSIQ